MGLGPIACPLEKEERKAGLVEREIRSRLSILDLSDSCQNLFYIAF